jgi:hypothetical protein
MFEDFFFKNWPNLWLLLTNLKLYYIDNIYLFPATLDHLLKQENIVLEYWTHRKKRLDHCQQFVLFESSAKQVRITLCTWLMSLWVTMVKHPRSSRETSEIRFGRKIYNKLSKLAQIFECQVTLIGVSKNCSKGDFFMLWNTSILCNNIILTLQRSIYFDFDMFRVVFCVTCNNITSQKNETILWTSASKLHQV